MGNQIFGEKLEKGIRYDKASLSASSPIAIATFLALANHLLFAFASPKRDPAQWTMEPGFGYALQFDPALWQRANVMEVVSPIPWSGEPPLAQRESL